MNVAKVDDAISTDELLGKVVDEFLERQQNGEAPSPDEYVSRYPELAHSLKKVLPTLQLLQLPESGSSDESASDASGFQPEQPLGDFRVLRELGRGGMGIVYEAVQISLGRNVALKVLPFASTMDPRQLQRFKNEAMAAASLDNPHIVDVYGVGCERGVHYYAMRLIDGHTLADVIAQLVKLRQEDRQAPDSVSDVLANTPPSPSGNQEPTIAYANPQAAETLRELPANVATKKSTFTTAYYRSIAELAMHVAEALDHAHQEGIVHRDVKPSNLMLDGNGKVWVTDFGLAQIESAGNLTMTGDLIGTLRYMSPEQVLAKRVPIDHRSDVYSLGATLYELLTLRPAFPGEDRQELLRQISFEEPTSPQRINRSIPTDLATIAMKAMEKNPADRYASAKEMAEDLGHYLEDRPIKAKRPSLSQRGRKWVRRHPVLTWSVCLALLTLLIGGGGTWAYFTMEKAALLAAADQRVTEYLDKAETAVKAGDWPQARASVRSAEAILVEHRNLSHLKPRLQSILVNVELVRELEEDRAPQQRMIGSGWAIQTDSAFTETFEKLGINLKKTSAEDAAQRLGKYLVPIQIAAALDYWAGIRKDNKEKRWKKHEWEKLWAISRLVDPDPWRNKVRDAVAKGDGQALVRLAEAPGSHELAPESLELMAEALWDANQRTAAITLARKAQQKYPGDYFLTKLLATYLYKSDQVEEAVRFQTAALALRPKIAIPHNDLSNYLSVLHRREEALASIRRAVQLAPDNSTICGNLSVELEKHGHHEEAIAAGRKAIKLAPNDISPISKLSLVFAIRGNLGEALKLIEKAIELDDKIAYLWANKAAYLRRLGKYEEAIIAADKALELNPRSPYALCWRGLSYSRVGKAKEARDDLKRAVELGIELDDDPLPTSFIRILERAELIDELAQVCRKAASRRLQRPDSYLILGQALERNGRFAGAIYAFRRGTEVHPTEPRNWNAMGKVLCNLECIPEAVDAIEHAVAIWDKHESWQDPHHGIWKEAIRLLLKAKQFDRVIEWCQKALEKGPTNKAQAYRIMGDAYWAKGDYAHAIDSYCQSHHARPRGFLYYLRNQRLDQVFANEEERNAFEEAIIQAINDQPNKKMLYELRAHFYALEGRRDEIALAAYRKAFAVAPLSFYYLTLANALLRQGEEDEAMSFYQKAFLQNSRTTSPKRIYTNEKEREAFFSTLDRSIRKDPKNTVLYQLRGHLAALEQRWQDAAEDYQRVLDLNPEESPLSVRRICEALVALFAIMDDQKQYHEHCTRFLTRIERSPEKYSTSRLLKDFYLLPPNPEFPIPNLGKVLSAVPNQTEDPGSFSYLTVHQGLADLRLGKVESACELFKRCNSSTFRHSNQKIQTKSLLAIAEHRLGNEEKARKLLEDVHQIVREEMPSQPPAVNWIGWIHSRVLYREAERLLGKKSSDGSSGETP